MNFPEIKWFIPLLLVSAGSIMLFVLWRINRRGQQALQLIDQIYELNVQHHQDLLTFLKGLPDALTHLEDFAGLKYQLDWYGQTVHESVGLQSRFSCKIPLTSDDVQLSLILYWSRKPVGERLLFQEVLLRTVTSIMQMNMLIKQQTQSQAQQQAAQAMLFLRHDIKNLAQFIQLQNDMLARVEQSPTEKVLARVTRSSKLAQQQADEILLRLQTDSVSQLARSHIDLAAVCQQKADASGLRLDLQGEGTVALPPSVLDRVLENLYANAKQHAAVTVMQVRLQPRGDFIDAVFTQQTPIESELLIRLFEPLFSGTGEPGRGIGMYQCRSLLRQYGGEIRAASCDNSAFFTLRLPRAVKVDE